jgi:glycosyltransferase involved in cell wall biosynthesis
MSRRKVIFVYPTYPATGGGRVERFVRYIGSHGFQPVVLATSDGEKSPPGGGDDRTNRPPSVAIHRARPIGWTRFYKSYISRARGGRHYQILRLLSFPERCVYVPDVDIRWFPSACGILKRLAKAGDIEAIVTSSPPESAHLVGMWAKRRLGIPWVADFRDLWTQKKHFYRPATPLHDWFIRRLEKRVMAGADHIIANTPENVDVYRTDFRVPDERVTYIPNGFDREDLDRTDSSCRQNGRRFTIGYLGYLDKHDFPWREFLLAMKQLIAKNGNDVRFKFCGYATDDVANFVHSEQLDSYVDARGMLRHRRAVNEVAESDLLLALLYENEYSHAIVPGKLYNYLHLHKPILAVAPEHGATARIINTTRTGWVVSPTHGVDGILKVLERAYSDWSSGGCPLEVNEEAIARFDCAHLTGQLAEVLSRVSSA